MNVQYHLYQQNEKPPRLTSNYLKQQKLPRLTSNYVKQQKLSRLTSNYLKQQKIKTYALEIHVLPCLGKAQQCGGVKATG